MAFTPTPGSAGRITSLAITPVLTTPLVTFAGALVALAEITSYRVTVNTVGEPPKVWTFESAASAEGMLGSTAIRGGLEDWSVDIEGVQDIATPFTDSRLSHGKFIYFSLYAFKSTPVGWPNCQGRIDRYGPAMNLRDPHANFSISVTGFGIFPLFAVITP